LGLDTTQAPRVPSIEAGYYAADSLFIFIKNIIKIYNINNNMFLVLIIIFSSGARA